MAKVALLFPGQGSQRVGMGKLLYDRLPQARAVFDRASSLLEMDIRALCFTGPVEELKLTQNAQVALYVAGVAAWSCLEAATGLKPDAAAGHSVGEYAALTASGCLPFDDGVKLVRRRGELMLEAAQRRPGAMVAVLGMEVEKVRAVCKEARAATGQVVSVANINGAGQVVISGERAAVDRAVELAKAAGARRVIELEVSGPFHSPLMAPAGDELYHDLARTPFAKPAYPVVSNISASYVEQPADVTGGLTLQVSGCVRWEESMRLLLRDGFDLYLELGCGEVLTGLMRRMAPEVTALAVQDPESLERAAELLEVRALKQGAEAAEP